MSTTDLIPLTGQQKNTLHELADAPPHSPAFALTGAANPHLRVMVVHFDGTENDCDHVKRDERATLVAESHRHFEANGGPAIKSMYYRGVGTTGSFTQRKIEAATGVGCRANAHDAYTDLARQVERWRREDPDVQVHVHVVGFSRGAATALHYMNIVDQVGIMPPDVDKDAFFSGSRTAPHLRPGLVKTSAVLFDTVSTGVKDLMLSLPASNISTLHLTAGGEERASFKLTSLVDPGRPTELAMATNVAMEGNGPGPDGVLRYRRLHEVCLPGARHSDVGGDYLNGGIRELSGYLMREFQRTLGLPVHSIRPTVDAIQKMRANDSRWKLLRLDHSIENRLKATRELEGDIKTPQWDGCYTEQATVTCGHGDATTTTEKTRVVRSSEHDWKNGINPAHLGRSYFIEWRLEAAGVPGEKPRLVTHSDSEGSFSFDKKTGELLLNGVAVRGAPKHEEISAAVRSAGRVKIEIGLEKGVPVFDARQVPVELAAPPAPQELWPHRFIEAIKTLNERGAWMRAHDAQELLYDCMSAAADAIRGNFPAVTSVGVSYSVERHSVIAADAFVDVNFDLKCMRGQAPAFSHDSEALNRDEYAMAIYLKALKDGLECVTRTMIEVGQPVPSVGRQAFGRATQPQLIDQLSVPMAPTLSHSLLSGISHETSAAARSGPAPWNREALVDDVAPVRRLRVVK